MPILGREVRGGIKGREDTPDRLGEEGRVHFFEIGDKAYAAKQWHGMGEKRLVLPENSPGSPCSPYWVKDKFYEYSLIRSVFPGRTLNMVAAYDERIQKDLSGKLTFDMMGGKPVTVSEKVVGDPEQVSVRDHIIQSTYDEMFAYHRNTGHGRTATKEQRARFYHVIAQADKAMQQLFGEELSSPLFHPDRPDESFRELLANAKAINPDSIVVEMIEYGILPIHAEFNFIPETEEKAPQRPHGTFIELAVMDVNRFYKKVTESSLPNKEKLIKRVENLAVIRFLDMWFDGLTALNPNQRIGMSKEFQSALFRLLESVREKFYKYGPAARTLAQQVHDTSVEAVHHFGDAKVELVNELDDITNHVKSLKPTKVK